jgi:hypothetical protein
MLTANDLSQTETGATQMANRAIMPIGLAAVLVMASAVWSGEVDDWLAVIRSVGKEGKGNARAATATNRLIALGQPALLPTLKAFDAKNPIANNWLLTAVNGIVQGDARLPAAELEAFVVNRQHAVPAREIAYELLVKADPTKAQRLLPGMLDDPSAALRRQAVAAALRAVPESGGEAQLQKLLLAARDKDQIEEIANRLETLGKKIDLTRHFGFITRWHVLAPLEGNDRAGFRTVYPPEEKVDLAATYPGRAGKMIGWRVLTTKHQYGVLDLNQAIEKVKGVVAFAYAVIESPGERAVQIRVGTPNSLKVYFNGKLAYAHEEYHHGMDQDQYIVPVVLRKGPNTLLLKIVQNDQPQAWADRWMFQCRITDELGGGIVLSTNPQ